MTQHLSDEEFCRIVNREPGEGAQDHLDQCASCRAECEELETGVEDYRRWVESESERPEVFWLRQRDSISRKVDRGAPRPRLVWALASIACAAILAAALIVEREPRVQVANVDPDHELLLDIERTLRQDVPEALAPAELLIEEIRLAVAAHTNNTRGERQ